MAATNAGFVNINSDLGESFGPWVMGNDVEVLKIVKSANVACGFHASDPTVMVDTVKLCQQNGVSIGAHPGFADLQGFGRRVINLSVKELEANIAYQLGALQGIASLFGAKVTHIKPHGMMGQAVAHVRRMVDEQAIYSTAGKRIPCQVDSICVHGDGPTAVTVSTAVRQGLEAAGIRIVPLTEMPNLKH